MKCSIVMSTFNRPLLLRNTLQSIRSQMIPFEHEIIVVDDGPQDSETLGVCQRIGGVKYLRNERPPDYANPGRARNLGYREARGEVVICQSDDVLHESPDVVAALVAAVTPENLVIAKVYDKQDGIYTGTEKPSPLFFLGAVLRRHIYAIGGNDEEFTEPGYDDNFFSDCLTIGLGLKPVFDDSIVGQHQHHPRPSLRAPYRRMRVVYERRYAYAAASGKWQASGGPWEFDQS